LLLKVLEASMARPVRKRVLWATLVVAGVAASAIGVAQWAIHRAQRLRPVAPIDRNSPEWLAREDALARARVFLPERPDPAAHDFSRNPKDVHGHRFDREVRCKYVPKRTSGTTPKFDCALEDGDVVKVKFGRTHEIQGEVAATRLLSALGFPADYVSLVEHVRCDGCPLSPFRMRQIFEGLNLAEWFDRHLDYGKTRDFRWASVEMKFEGDAIEVGDAKGWNWTDLDAVRADRGGATRAELDALRLVAVLLAYWDNKPTNQRLVCLDQPADDPLCHRPLLMLQDLGATFGPRKVDLDRWSATPIWAADTAGCVATMESLPYHGATFKPVAISEGGRRLVAERLRQLTEQQMLDLFRASRFPNEADVGPPGTGAEAWVEVLQKKIREIADRSPCAL
jgi:hypothetical protein